MFGIEELEEIMKEIEEAIAEAKRADVPFKNRREELLKLLGKREEK